MFPSPNASCRAFRLFPNLLLAAILYDRVRKLIDTMLKTARLPHAPMVTAHGNLWSLRRIAEFAR